MTIDKEAIAELSRRYLALHRTGIPTPEVRERLGIDPHRDFAMRRRLGLLYRYPPKGDAEFRYPRLTVLTAAQVERMERRRVEREREAGWDVEAESIRREAEKVRAAVVRHRAIEASRGPLRVTPSLDALRAAWWGEDRWARIEAAGIARRPEEARA